MCTPLFIIMPLCTKHREHRCVVLLNALIYEASSSVFQRLTKERARNGCSKANKTEHQTLEHRRRCVRHPTNVDGTINAGLVTTSERLQEASRVGAQCSNHAGSAAECHENEEG